jgi:hypothetical protein
MHTSSCLLLYYRCRVMLVRRLRFEECVLYSLEHEQLPTTARRTAGHGTLKSVFQNMVFGAMARHGQRTSHLTRNTESSQHHEKTLPA